MMNAGNLNGKARQMKDWRRRLVALVAALSLLISSCGLTAFAESDEDIYSAPVTAPIAPANTSPEPEEGGAEVTPAPEGQDETGTEPAEETGEETGTEPAEETGEETGTETGEGETEGEPEVSEEPEDLTVYESGTLTAEADGINVTLDYAPEARIPEGAVLTLARATGGDLYSTMKAAARVLKEEANETWKRELGDEAVFYLLTLTTPEGIELHPTDGLTLTCTNLSIPAGSTGFVTGTSAENIDWDGELTLAFLPDAIGYANLKQVQIGTITLVHNDRDYMVTASYGPEAGFPVGTALKVREIMPGTPEYALYSGMTDEALNEDWSEITLERYFDIAFVKDDEELEPQAEVDVQITFRDKIEENEDTEVAAVHIENNEATVIESETDSQVVAKHDDEAIDTVTFTSDSFSVYGVVQKKKIITKLLEAGGQTYEIGVTYTQEAEIPEDAQIKVEEIPEGSDLYNAYKKQTAAALNADDVRLPGLYDISIVDAEGNKVTPQVPVSVAIKLLNDENTTEDIQVVHFKEEMPEELVEAVAQTQETTEQTEVQTEPLAEEDKIESEEIKASVKDDAVTFETDSFSVFAFAYTVDFYFGVNGITVEYHIPGGAVQSLRELLTILKIVEDDQETESDEVTVFINGIETVAFSDDSLVKVVRVSEDTTAGEIIDSLGLEITYAGNLTEEDVSEMRAIQLTAPDWALVSLKPFLSEELLTITMNNGEVVKVKVTDQADDPSGFIGKLVIVYDNGEKRAMTADWEQNDYRTQFNSVPVDGADSNEKARWTVESSNGAYYLKSYNEKYLKFDYNNVNLVDSRNDATPLTIYPGNNPDYRIFDKNNENNCLCYCTNGQYNGFFSARGKTYGDQQQWLYIKVANYTPKYTVKVNDNNAGYLTQAGSGSFSGTKTEYTAASIVATDGYYTIYNPTYAAANTNWSFAYWVKDDDSKPVTLNNTELRGSGGGKAQNRLDRDTTYIAFFAPANEYIVRVNSAEPSDGQIYTSASNGMPPRSLSTNTNNNKVFNYYYTSDNLSIIAGERTNHEFLGWYHDYDAVTGTGELISTDSSYNISGVKRHLNLTPVYEPDADHRDYYNVWFDGSNGAGNGTFNSYYTRIESDTTKKHGSTSVYQQVSKDSATINLPMTAADPQSVGANHFTLSGWYDIKTGTLYNPGAEVTITQDTVFYASWFAGDYSFSSSENAISTTNTNNFITTTMYDFNNLYNMQGLTLTSSVLNRIENRERWSQKEGNQFLFIGAFTGEGSTTNPYNRDDANSSREISTSGTEFNGTVTSGLFSRSPFASGNTVGVRNLGTGNYLYKYDTSTGYYYYDSDKNAASFNKNAGRFYVYSYKNKTDKSSDGSDFLPLNAGNSTFTEAWAGPNYWFGMKSSINFFLPNDTGFTDEEGKTGNRSSMGDEMVYKFAGDDDVWVFVDNQLILDMGGIHGKVYGEINFSKGTWTIAQSGATKTTDEDGIMTYGSGGDIKTKSFSLGEGEHTLTLYYLERGASQSHCAIYFNIAPKYSMQIIKRDANTNNGLGGAEFAIYTDPECTKNANLENYYGGGTSETFTTGSDGLKHCKGLIAGHTYYIKEITAPNGYPNVSDEVISLIIKSDGKPRVETTAGIDAEVEYSADGTYMLYLTVFNTEKPLSVKLRKYVPSSDGTNAKVRYIAGIRFKAYTKANYESGGAPIDPDTTGIAESYFDEETKEFITDSLGRFYEGIIKPGTYYLVETSVPYGIKMPANPVIKLTIGYNSANNKFYYSINDGPQIEKVPNNSGTTSFDVEIPNELDTASVQIEKIWTEATDAKAVLLKLGRIANEQDEGFIDASTLGLSSDKLYTYNGTNYIKITKNSSDWPVLTIQNLPMLKAVRMTSPAAEAIYNYYYYIEEFAYIDANDQVIEFANDPTLTATYSGTNTVDKLDHKTILAQKDPDKLTVTNSKAATTEVTVEKVWADGANTPVTLKLVRYRQSTGTNPPVARTTLTISHVAAGSLSALPTGFSATYTIVSESGTVVQEDAEDGVQYEVEPGSYTVSATVSNYNVSGNNYVDTPDVTVSVTSGESKTATVTSVWSAVTKGAITIAQNLTGAGAESSTFTGTYTVKKDGNTIANGTGTYSGKNGITIADLDEGEYTVEVTGSDTNYNVTTATQSTSVTVTAGQTATATVSHELTERPGSIQIRQSLTGAATSSTTFSASYVVKKDGTQVANGTYTNTAGATVSGLLPGNYTVEVTGEDSAYNVTTALQTVSNVSVTAGNIAQADVTHALTQKSNNNTGTVTISVSCSQHVINTSGAGTYNIGDTLTFTCHVKQNREIRITVDDAVIFNQTNYGDQNTWESVSFTYQIPSSYSNGSQLTVNVNDDWWAMDTLTISRNGSSIINRAIRYRAVAGASDIGSGIPGIPSGYVRDDSSTDITINLPDGGAWQKVIDDLPVYDQDGNVYYYRLIEENVSSNYEVSYSSNNPIKADEMSASVTLIATNTPKTGNLSVTKYIDNTTGGTKSSFQFKVTLGDNTINGTFGGMTFTAGVADFSLGNNETVTATGLPAGISYTVVETDANQNHYVTTWTGSTTGTIPANSTAVVECTNTYSYTPTGSVAFTAHKTLTGGTLTDGEFVFKLIETNAEWTPLGAGEQTATNNGSGDVIFTDVVLTTTATRYFIIREINTTDQSVPYTADPSVEYDTHEQKITVTVTDDNNGNLVPAKSYEPGIEAGSAYDAAFINTKKGALTVTKAMDSQYLANAAEKTFTFVVTLTDSEDQAFAGSVTVQDQTRTTAQEVAADAEGKITLTVQGAASAYITNIPVGTKYTVEEQSLPTGWKQVGQVAITGGNSDRSIDAGETEIATVTNEYVPVGTVSFNAKKVFTGGELLEDNKFTFALTETDDTWTALPTGQGVSLTAQNETNGDVSFGTVDLTSTSTRYFIITETVGTDSSIIYDNHEQKITLTITDNDGVLVATKAYDPTREGSDTDYDATFENVKKVELSIKKVVLGIGSDDASADGEYTFRIKGIEETDTAGYDAVVVITITSGAMASATINGVAAGANFTVANGVKLTELVPGNYTIEETAWPDMTDGKMMILDSVYHASELITLEAGKATIEFVPGAAEEITFKNKIIDTVDITATKQFPTGTAVEQMPTAIRLELFTFTDNDTAKAKNAVASTEERPNPVVITRDNSGTWTSAVWTELQKYLDPDDNTSDPIKYAVEETGIYFGTLVDGQVPDGGWIINTTDPAYTGVQLADLYQVGYISGTYTNGMVDTDTEANAASVITVINEPVTIDVPVEKTWDINNEDENTTWTATFQLEEVEEYVMGTHATNPISVRTPVSPAKMLTISKGDTGDTVEFTDLPKYHVYEDGGIYRILYYAEETAYEVKQGDETINKWDNINGQTAGDKQYMPIVTHAAGDTNDDLHLTEDSEQFYTIILNNRIDKFDESRPITVSLQKNWANNEADDVEGAYADFKLKRYYQEGYREFSTTDFNGTDKCTVTVGNASIEVFKGAKVSIIAKFKPGDSGKGNLIIQDANWNKIYEYNNTEYSNVGVVKKIGTFIVLDNVNYPYIDGQCLESIEISDLMTSSEWMPDGGWSKDVHLSDSNSWKSGDISLNTMALGEYDAATGKQLERVYSYYFEETSSNPENFYAEYTSNNATLGDISNRITSNADVVATNKEKKHFRVSKLWQALLDSDLKYYPEVSFTLYRIPEGRDYVSVDDIYRPGSPNDNSFVNIKLNYGNNWTWDCPVQLPETYQENGQTKYWRYYVIETPKDASQTVSEVIWTNPAYNKLSASQGQDNDNLQITLEGYRSRNSLTGDWNDSYGNGNSSQTQGGTVITTYAHALADRPQDAAIGNEGEIQILNKTIKYIQMDIKKKFLRYVRNSTDNGWNLETYTTSDEVLHDLVLEIQVKRRIVRYDSFPSINNDLTPDGGGDPYAVIDTWKDYGKPVLVGYGQLHQAVTYNPPENPFRYRHAGLNWHWTIDNEYQDKGLPAYGFYPDPNTGEIIPVRYQYILVETNAYSDLQKNNPRYWFNVLPAAWDGAKFKVLLYPKVIAQDEDRLVNIKSTSINITKEWNGGSGADAVYIKVWRKTSGGTFTDYTNTLQTDINQIWQNRKDGLVNTSNLKTVGTENYLIIPKGDTVTIDYVLPMDCYSYYGDGNDSAAVYYYKVQEYGYRLNGEDYWDVTSFDPEYEFGQDAIVSPAGGNTIVLDTNNANRNLFKIINTTSTDFTVEKKWQLNYGLLNDPWSIDNDTTVNSVEFSVTRKGTKYTRTDTYSEWTATTETSSDVLTFTNGTTEENVLKIVTDGKQAKLTVNPSDATKYTVAYTDYGDNWQTFVTGLQVENEISETEKWVYSYQIAETAIKGTKTEEDGQQTEITIDATKYTKGYSVSASGGTVLEGNAGILLNNHGTATITNSIVTPGTIVINKKSEPGSLPGDNDFFTFNVTMTDENGNPLTGNVMVQDYDYPTATSIPVGENGIISVIIQGRGTATISEVPAGTRYSVEEEKQDYWRVHHVVHTSTLLGHVNYIIEGGETEYVNVYNEAIFDITVRKIWNGSFKEWPEGYSVDVILKVNGKDDVTLPPYNDSEQSLTATIDGQGPDGDKHIWHGLPRHDEDGNPITYTVEETAIRFNGELLPPEEKYITTGEGGPRDVLGNVLIHNIITTNVIAKKQWEDDNDKYGLRPKSLTFTLVAKAGNPERTLTEQEMIDLGIISDNQPIEKTIRPEEGSNDWSQLKAEWTKLPKFTDPDANNQIEEISYSVTESVEEGDGTLDNYKGVFDDYSGSNAFTKVVTYKNTLIRDSVVLKGQKLMDGFEDHKYEEFEFIISASDDTTPMPALTRVGIVRMNPIWVYNFGTIEYLLRDLGGSNTRTFTYTIEEIKDETKKNIEYDDTVYTVYVTVTYDPTSKTMSHSIKYKTNKDDTVIETDGDDINFNFDNKELTEVEITKLWSPNPPAGGTVTFDIYEYTKDENGEDVFTSLNKPITLDGEPDTTPVNPEAYESAKWKAKWSKLPKYRNKTEIQYVVKETGITPAQPAYIVDATFVRPIDGTGTITNALYRVQVQKTYSGVEKLPDDFAIRAEWDGLSPSIELIPDESQYPRTIGNYTIEIARSVGDQGTTYTWTICGLAQGTTVKFTEMNYTHNGYTMTNMVTQAVIGENGEPEFEPKPGTEGYAEASTEEPLPNGAKVIFENTYEPGVELPSTGGSGTLIYTIAGMALVVLAGVLLVSRRKKRT